VRKVLLFYFLLFVTVIAVDQASKWYVLHLARTSYSLLPCIRCELSFNPGVSWGLFQTTDKTLPIVLLVLIVGIIVSLAFLAYRNYKAGYSIIAEMLVIGGALSNLIDRFVHGAVVDFILIGYKGVYFPTFNVADVAIVGGVIVLFIREIFRRP
jgi:signal peptidase II